MNTETQAAFRFFLREAACDARRAVYALRLARAEQIAAERGWTTAWYSDPISTCDGCASCERGLAHQVEGCVLYDERGRPIGHVDGVFEARLPWRRIVEAELMAEALEARPNITWIGVTQQDDDFFFAPESFNSRQVSCVAG